MSEAFDHIPYEDLEQPFKTLGSGSFGSVYRSTYLGLPVAIKEIHPSTSYDVSKYFEREWRLMREARHPNVVLYLGLSKAPPASGKKEGTVYIVSEYVEGGNLRGYIHDRRKPFPWSVRLSFATDIARALAYLHARKCIHRDLKPENLLLTSNLRLKITDFGFARIAPRSTEESKRLTFCGTDAYMSPEILMGDPFGLATDIFSLGVIFTEMLSRTLADDHNFKRCAPSWVIDADEVRRKADEGCPAAFVDLAVECMTFEPSARPGMMSILERLRGIEVLVFEREQKAEGGATHVGSVKFATGGIRRPKMMPRIPSFGGAVVTPISTVPEKLPSHHDDDEPEDGNSSEDELEAALKDLEMATTPTPEATYSTMVVKKTSSMHKQEGTATVPPNMSSILTIRPSDINGTTDLSMEDVHAAAAAAKPNGSAMSIDSFHTASASSEDDSDDISVARATLSSTIRSLPQTIAPPHTAAPTFHRFTMIRPGSKGNLLKKHTTPSPSPSPPPSKRSSLSWSPFDFLLGLGKSKLNGEAPTVNPVSAKCDMCRKRLGVGIRTVLECDDCGIRVHLKCGQFAPQDCHHTLEAQGHEDAAMAQLLEKQQQTGGEPTHGYALRSRK